MFLRWPPSPYLLRFSCSEEEEGHLTNTWGDKQIPPIMQATMMVTLRLHQLAFLCQGPSELNIFELLCQRPIAFLLLRLSCSEEEEEVIPTTRQLFDRFLRPGQRLMTFVLRLVHQFEFLCQGPNAFSLTTVYAADNKTMHATSCPTRGSNIPQRGDG